MPPIWLIFINLILTYISYPLVDIFLSYYYNKYSRYDDKKKNYIKKNFIKSYVLYYLSISTIPLIPVIFLNIGDFNFMTRFVGSLYTSGDTIALFKNMKLSTTTKYHHIITTFLSFINFFIDWKTAGVIPKLMGLYAILSCYSYDVNKCLALRFLENDETQKKMKRKALIIYLILCFFNWSVHMCVFFNNIKNMDLIGGFYFLLVMILAYDDIVLMNWLKN